MEIIQTQHIQMTEQEYQESKREIKERFCRIANDALYIGWKLTCIEESGAYRYDGYESMKEFAEAEYKMSADKISRYPRVYKKYGIPGEIPQLKQEYEKYNFSQLIEMLQIPEEDEAMIRPELKRDGIRELAKFNKENENSPNNLLGWQQDPEKDLKCAILEFFRNRKESLNSLYASEAYAENNIPEMIQIIRHNQKKQFRDSKTSIFMILYEDQIFVKAFNKDPQDITWEQFFEITREIFDHAAAGGLTWEHHFEPEKFAQEEQIPGQDNIMNHPEYMPEPQGQLHGRKFQNCIYKEDEACISENCDQCQMQKEYQKEEKEKKQREEEEAVAVFAENSPGKLEKIMAICRENKPQDRAKAVQKHLAPYGHSGSSHGDYSETFYGFSQGIRLEYGENKISMKYSRFVELLVKLYGPCEYTEEIAPAQKEDQNCIHRPEFTCTLSEAQKLTAGDGQDCSEKCCWNCQNHGSCGYECNSSAHRPDEDIAAESEDAAKMQQETEKRCGNSSEISDIWPEDLSDIPVPSWTAICDILWEAENDLKEYLACEGLPERTILKEQLITGGLRLIKNLVREITEEEE